MILRIDHVALAVENYEKAREFFSRLFGAIPCSYADDPHMKYHWQLMALGDLSRIELLTPTGPGSFLDGFLQKKHGGVHHITMQTPDIQLARQILDRNGIPYFGFNDYGPAWKELFIHPRHAFGVLIQIAEFTSDDWLSPGVKMPAGKTWEVESNGSGVRLTLSHPGGGKVKIDLSAEEAERLSEALKTTS